MKKKQSAILKWLLLAVCLFAAGCFYSCGSQAKAQKEGFIQESGAFQAESAPESVGSAAENEVTENTSDMNMQGETEPVLENSSAAEAVLCYVYVCGEVQSPGVYTLPEGARIYEAIDLAGGFTGQAAEFWLNLAEPVADGMKLEVPSRTQAEDPAWQAKSGNAAGGNRGEGMSGQTVLVNINTASQEELMSLKGIGASRAEDIIRYRKEAGGFTKIEDIMKVPGIKDAAFQKIKENITV